MYDALGASVERELIDSCKHQSVDECEPGKFTCSPFVRSRLNNRWQSAAASRCVVALHSDTMSFHLQLMQLSVSSLPDGRLSGRAVIAHRQLAMPAARASVALLRAFSLSTGDACQISWIGYAACANQPQVAAACAEISIVRIRTRPLRSRSSEIFPVRTRIHNCSLPYEKKEKLEDKLWEDFYSIFFFKFLLKFSLQIQYI